MSDDERTIELLIERAQGCLERNDLDGAIDLIERALAIDPDFAELHAWLACILVDRRLLAAARAEAELSLALDASVSRCHLAMGLVQIAEGKRRDGKLSIATAVDLEPDNAHNHLQLARAKRLLGEDDQDSLDQALELEPEDPSILAACSQAKLHHGQLDEAERFAREALEIDPEHGEALVAMGWVLLRKGELDDAREHAAMALRADPSDRDALGLLAAYKARKSWILGLWFRWAMLMSDLGDRREIIVLLALFLVYRLAMLILDDLGLGEIAEIVSRVWLVIIVYSWGAPALFKRMIDRELEQIRLDPDY